jgi:hypothetical protein
MCSTSVADKPLMGAGQLRFHLGDGVEVRSSVVWMRVTFCEARSDSERELGGTATSLTLRTALAWFHQLGSRVRVSSPVWAMAAQTLELGSLTRRKL